MTEYGYRRALVTLVAVAVGAAAVAGAPRALAQNAAANATPAEGALEEIVVTAQKRAQNVQDVPIAVSVLTGAEVESRGGLNVESLKEIVPSLNFLAQNTSLNNSLFLRGVGTINFALLTQPSVAYVLDGVVLSAAGEAFSGLFDVDRVEVLRGPQGTLFGKNSSAGVVNVVSKRPGREFAGAFDANFAEGEESMIKGAFDVPLSDSTRTRTTLFWANYPGYLKNLSTTAAGGSENGYHQKGIRTIVVSEVSEKLQITAIGDYRHSDDNCCAYVVGTAPTGAAAPGLLEGLAGTVINGDAGRTIRSNLQGRQYERDGGVSLQLDYDFGAVTLTSISAWRKWDITEIRDGNWTDVGGQFVGVTQQHDFGPQSNRTTSEELRLTSPSGGFLEWVAGLYYSRLDAQRYFQRDDVACTASTAPLDASGARPCNAPGFSSTIVTGSANASFNGTLNSIAAFGDTTFRVTDALRVIAGLRWTQDKTSYWHHRNPSLVAGLPGILTTTSDFGDADTSSNISGRAGVQYDVNRDFMTYLTYARGYKGPTYNVFFNMAPTNRNLIDAETGDSVELGFKSTVFGGTTTFNGDVYYAKYKNFQANNPTILNGSIITTITNAGDVSSRGVELEFRSRPTRAMNLWGGISYNPTRIESVNNLPGAPSPNIVGTVLPFAPKWKGTLSGDYTFHVGRFDLAPSVTYSYQTDEYSLLNAPAPNLIKAYGILDAQLTLTEPESRYSIAVVGHNLGDKSYATNIVAGGGIVGGAFLYQVPRDAQRYFGVQIHVPFGGK